MGTPDDHPLHPRSLGESLLILRHRSGLTRDDLSARSGVATGTITRYEHDETARVDMQAVRRILMVLADAAGMDASDLWTAIGVVIDLNAWELAADATERD